MKKNTHHSNAMIPAKVCDDYLKSRFNRRTFLKYCAAAGLTFTSPYFLTGCTDNATDKPAPKKIDVLGPQSAITAGTDQHKFLAEMGTRFSGTTLHVVSEDTPPANAVKQLLAEEFTPVTGIRVEWESMALDRVLAKVVSDTSRQVGNHDIFYLDQAWIGRFVDECIDPRQMLENKDLAYPGYNFDDFLQPLIKHVASYNGKLAALPFDIPIFMTIYRKDLFEELGLNPPGDLDAYMEVVQAINDAKAPGIYGTTAGWKSGNYSLECSMTTWLWGHGGSIFGKDGRSLINDDRAYAAMEYMIKLQKYMAPGATNWDWFGEADSFARGEAGIMTSWSEYFALFDDPAKSKIVGLAEPAPCPRPYMLRPADECGFGEVPGASHQGGSSLAISRYSKNIDAAWILMQWATCPDVTTRACVLSGAGNHVRKSNFDDERVRNSAKVQVHTTRHFDIALDAIVNNMGTEPHLPGWADLAVDSFSVELSRMITGLQNIETTLNHMHRAAEKAAALAGQA